MATQPIPKLKETFSDNKEPNGQDFANLIDSFYHKSTLIDQSRILGLQQSFDDKASKDDLKNLASSVNLLGEKANIAEIKAINDPQRNDTYKAKDTGHYWKYNAVIDVNNPYNPDNWLDIGELIPSDVVPKSEVDLKALQSFGIVSNQIFVLAITDIDNNIIWGLYRDDLAPYEAEISTATARALVNFIKRTDVLQVLEKSELPVSGNVVVAVQNAINEKIDKLDFPTLELFKTISNETFVFAVTDKNDNVIWGLYRDDLAPYEVEISTATARALANFLNDINTTINSVQNAINEKIASINQLISTISNDHYIKVETDKEGKILHYVLPDGTYVFKKLQLPDDLEAKLKTGNYCDFSNEKSMRMGFPTSLAKVIIQDIEVKDLPLNKASVECHVVFYVDGHFFYKKAEVSYQGSSSMNFPEKNLSIDFLNEDGSSFNLSFGKWVATNKYHLKVNWIDATHARNVCANRLYEQMVQTRPFDTRRPWDVPYFWQNGIIDEQIETGAMGHIDGFPAEVYFGDKYYGLATQNLTKNRVNYNMKKKDNGIGDARLRIQLELGGGAFTNNDWSEFDWRAYEIRNPEVTVNGQDYWEGATPDDSPMKDATLRLFDWLKTVSETDFKNQANDYLHIDSLIDYIILQQMCKNMDSWTRNGQLCTWDGLRWAVMPYDLDQAFGGHVSGITGVNAQGDALTNPDGRGNDIFWKRIMTLYKDEIEARYAELRNNNILTPSNFEVLFRGIIDVVGFEAYKKDLTTWDKPSFRPQNYVVENPSGFHKDGGFYTSLGHLMKWIPERLAYLDEMYNYNQ